MLRVRIQGLEFQVWRDESLLFTAFAQNAANTFVEFEESKNQGPERTLELQRRGVWKLVYSFDKDAYEVLNKNNYSVYTNKRRAMAEDAFNERTQP